MLLSALPCWTDQLHSGLWDSPRLPVWMEQCLWSIIPLPHKHRWPLPGWHLHHCRTTSPTPVVYAVQQSETLRIVCPCNKNPNLTTHVPDFVGQHHYCESGFSVNTHKQTAWGDPLWDGAGCTAAGNQCCERYSWFH